MIRLLWRLVVNRWRWYRLPERVRREAMARQRPNGWD